MDCQAGEVGDRLAVADQQGGTHVVEVDGPQHIPGHLQDVADQGEHSHRVYATPSRPGSGCTDRSAQPVAVVGGERGGDGEAIRSDERLPPLDLA